MRGALFILLLLVNHFSFAQVNIDFEPPDIGEIIFEPNDSTNIWQVGQPQKTIFDSSYSLPNALVTDTIDPYPINSTSSFIIKIPLFYEYGFWELWFEYKIHCDSLNDYGKIEASTDYGVTWFDMINDTADLEVLWEATNSQESYTHLDSINPFVGSSNLWTTFSLSTLGWFGTMPVSDTLLYRFTFVSDSIQTGKDGWMIDDISAHDWAMSIEEHDFNSLALIGPSPAKDRLNISLLDQAARIAELLVYDVHGRELKRYSPNIGNAQIDISELPHGVYLLQITTTEGKRSTTRFVKE